MDKVLETLLTKETTLGKVLQSLSNNQSLALGLVVCAAAPALIGIVAYFNVAPVNLPAMLRNDASEEEIKTRDREVEYFHQHQRLFNYVKLGVILSTTIVFVGGVYLVCHLNESKTEVDKLTKDLGSCQDLLTSEVAKNNTLNKDFDQLKNNFNAMENLLKETTKQIRTTFLEAANCGSSSFAWIKNDTDQVVKVFTWHSYGMNITETAHEILPKSSQVVGGNIHSWGVGQGMNVRVGDGPESFVRHGEICTTTELMTRSPKATSWSWFK
jgi:methyl-accepting chemotaxis protein